MSDRAVSANRQLKLLSLLLAALLWLFVALETNDEADIPLRVTYYGLPAGLSVRETVPLQGSIRAAGPRILLLRQRLKGAEARFDLSAVSVGKTLLAGFENTVIPVKGVRFIRVSPLTMEISGTSAGSAEK